MEIIRKIEEYKFECIGGPLDNCIDWEKLKGKVDLWVVCKEYAGFSGKSGPIVMHTSGMGGWRFSVHTNKEEAQATADCWNWMNYEGQPICVVRHLLSDVI